MEAMAPRGRFMMVSRSSAWTRRTVGARPSSRASLRSFAAANARCRCRRARSAAALAPSRRRSASTARSKLALAASSFPSRSSSRRPVGIGVAWAVQPRARSQSSDSAARANCMTERQASLAKQGEVDSGTIAETQLSICRFSSILKLTLSRAARARTLGSAQSYQRGVGG